jgi:hypothetical protein
MEWEFEDHGIKCLITNLGSFLLKGRMKINHQIPLMHTSRKRLELLVRLAGCVVVLEILLARKGRHHRDGVALCALVCERLAGFHRHDIGRAILFRKKKSTVS